MLKKRRRKKKMKRSNKYLLFIPLVFLTACGAYRDYLVPGNQYNSPVFTENYYTHWDSELKNARKVDAKDVTSDSITKFGDLGLIDPNIDAGIVQYSDAEQYGLDYKMNNLDDSFNYGYQSKLFDGRVICGGLYQLSRVQTLDKGFSIRFAKESDDLHYFAMQFKATTDNPSGCYIEDSENHPTRDSDLFHDSTIELTIIIYVRNNNSIEGHPYVATIDFDNNRTNNGAAYIFYAFSLEEEELSRAIGVSVEYTYQDGLIDWNKGKGIDMNYALFLYEMFLPYTYWH